MNFYKGIDNHAEIKTILKEFEVKYEKERDIEFFSEIMNGIEEDYPSVQNLSMVLERILVYLVNREANTNR